MSLHKEIAFEEEICETLAAHGWLYTAGDAARYDRKRALFGEDLIAWVQATQPEAWGTLTKNHGSRASETIYDRVRDQLEQRGTVDVLRHGVELVGLRSALRLAQFRPAFGVNDEIQSRYAANRLRVVRQVRYSVANENAIDLVLFLNGVPVATAELKTDFTQQVGDAIDQYRFDRHPRPKGQAPEPLLNFPGGAVVHFAVSNSEVAMTTRLEGPATQFLPFNRGDAGGAGNPPNPRGHRTAYLWEQIWQRDSWLEILGKYLVGVRDEKKKLKTFIFPRYHQLAATRKLRAAVLGDGAGKTYLIQHSAGSGKTNSIAWSAHFLADLHDTNDKKIFESVLVVSDRKVIDGQLQEAIFNFERTTGVVATIKGDGGSKSSELADALSGDKKVVVCTIQTFPHALKKVRELAATQGKRFAVIADEAHSSQAGESAVKLSEVLSPDEIAALRDGGEVSFEDVLRLQMQNRAGENGISFVAFTATPKSKTVELFGTRPDPMRPPSDDDNKPEPFHVYSMRQAIEEGFILDVLKNYTPYRLAFKLAHNGAEMEDREVERSAALKGIMKWVRLHPYNIAQKVEIVVEHFREFVAPLLNGKAKAMVVVGSRVEAVRWKLAIDKYIASRNYKLGTLVAFSGEVKDTDSGPDLFSETTQTMNPTLRGRDIRDAFKGEEFQILLVANKFQTGFDQPLLCGMYIDRRLADIQAVQTLSRLNRAHPGKDTTYVLDFCKDNPEEVLAAFRKYYETAELAGVSDQNLILNLKAKLDGLGYYDEHEVDRVVAVQLDERSRQGDLVAAITPVESRLMQRYKAARAALKTASEANRDADAKAAKDQMDALDLFKRDIAGYVRAYTFLSQIFDYGNTAVEKRSVFFKVLLPLLEFGRERDEIDLSKVVLTHHTLKSQGKRDLPLAADGDRPKLKPLTEIGGGEVREQEKALLNAIIQKVNDLFTGELTEQDKLVYVNNVLKGKLLESNQLRQQAASNSKEQFAASPDLEQAILNAVMDALDAHGAMSTQAINSKTIRDGLKDVLLNEGRLWESLRQPGTGA